MPLDVFLKPVETLLYRSDVVAIGAFRCAATHPLFHDSGPCTHHTFVFPRTATEIRHRGGASFVASAECVTLYNQHQAYSRRAISDEDASDWYVVADDILFEAAGRTSDHPFRATHVRIDSAMYLRQRSLFNAISEGCYDPLAVDETVLSFLHRILRSPAPPRSDRIERAKDFVAATYTDNESLRSIARAAGSSPFQLCRDFKAATGQTITAFKHSLRLRSALESLRKRDADITRIAVDLGYSSHSHFTAVFRRHFKMTPSQFRDSGRM